LVANSQFPSIQYYCTPVLLSFLSWNGSGIFCGSPSGISVFWRGLFKSGPTWPRFPCCSNLCIFLSVSLLFCSERHSDDTGTLHVQSKSTLLLGRRARVHSTSMAIRGCGFFLIAIRDQIRSTKWLTLWGNLPGIHWQVVAQQLHMTRGAGPRVDRARVGIYSTSAQFYW
jgi:hypothetical protein